MEKKNSSASLALALALLAVTATIMLVAAEAADSWKICNMNKDGLTACQPAISGSSAQKPVPDPSETCCAALSHADLNCLCGYKNSGLLQYFGINPDLAMQLPVKCNVPAPVKC
ncbi:putative lipid-transfer protein DIR1 [Dendrobium catenatum]|uniref:Lipid-transfer protein DIR1 n=1 Tax=Dendrobium catenatum TaxID=906689 RepID=A0A2I0WY44_9ASPA|nr:putative lipid-transfer protein DIR1 [Dendrobium catenatum]PKU80582.1 Putative lipid-transfer protein DIR1 [Dendrobium catenatum]